MFCYDSHELWAERNEGHVHDLLRNALLARSESISPALFSSSCSLFLTQGRHFSNLRLRLLRLSPCCWILPISAVNTQFPCALQPFLSRSLSFLLFSSKTPKSELLSLSRRTLSILSSNPPVRVLSACSMARELISVCVQWSLLTSISADPSAFDTRHHSPPVPQPAFTS